MTRYFLHLRDGTDVALDPEGQVFRSETELDTAMLRSVRDLMSSDVIDGRLDLRLRLDAETAGGDIVKSLSFTDGLEIIYAHLDAQSASG